MILRHLRRGDVEGSAVAIASTVTIFGGKVSPLQMILQQKKLCTPPESGTMSRKVQLQKTSSHSEQTKKKVWEELFV